MYEWGLCNGRIFIEEIIWWDDNYAICRSLLWLHYHWRVKILATSMLVTILGCWFVGDKLHKAVLHLKTVTIGDSPTSLSPFISDRESTFTIKLKSKVAYLCNGDLCNDDMKDFWKIFLDWIQGQGIIASQISMLFAEQLVRRSLKRTWIYNFYFNNFTRIYYSSLVFVIYKIHRGNMTEQSYNFWRICTTLLKPTTSTSLQSFKTCPWHL